MPQRLSSKHAYSEAMEKARKKLDVPLKFTSLDRRSRPYSRTSPMLKHKIVRCQNTHCRQRLNVPVGVGDLTLTCPKCRYRWDYTPRSILRRRRRVAAAVIAALLIVAVGLRWWGTQSRDLTRWKEQLASVERQRTQGNFPDAEKKLGDVETELANSGAVFPTLRAERDRLQEEVKSHLDKLEKAKEQQKTLTELSGELAQVRKALNQADLVSPTNSLRKVKLALANTVGWEPVMDHQSQRDMLQRNAEILLGKIETIRQQKKELEEIAGRLNEARDSLVKSKWKEAEQLAEQVQTGLSKALLWEVVAKLAEDRKALGEEANAFQAHFEAAYAAKLKEVLASAQSHLAKRETAQAKKLIDQAAGELGRPDPVLEDAGKFVGQLSEGAGKWGPEQEQALAGMAEEGPEWKKTRKKNTKADYSHFLAKNPKSAFAKVAKAKIVDFEVEEQRAGRFQALPDALPPIRRDKSLKHAVATIHNDTQYLLTVRYSGPESQKITVSPQGDGTLTLAAGTYTVSASVNAANVTPFIGSRTLWEGDFSHERFYIRTGFGTRAPFLP